MQSANPTKWFLAGALTSLSNDVLDSLYNTGIILSPFSTSLPINVNAVIGEDTSTDQSAALLRTTTTTTRPWRMWAEAGYSTGSL